MPFFSAKEMIEQFRRLIRIFREGFTERFWATLFFFLIAAR
jgi:hypothetical protein